jgi:membrane-associated phospholipid phosphatase
LRHDELRPGGPHCGFRARGLRLGPDAPARPECQLETVACSAHDRRRTRGAASELALVVAFAATYAAVRAVTEGRVEVALANARGLMGAEDGLRIAWERQLQALVTSHEVLTTIANWIYIYGHWPVIALSAAYLYARHRGEYLRLRNAMVISGLIGFVCFAFLPVAPPRLADPGLLDTIAEYSNGYRALQPPALTNQYAAMPSLHVGWNLLVAIALWRAVRGRGARALAAAMPAAMAFAAVATANHFVLDVLAGSLVVLVALALARAWSGGIAATLDGGGVDPATNALGAPPVRHRAPLGQLARGPARGRDARRRDGRGGRAPLSRPARGAPPEDARAGADPVGSVEARQPVPPAPAAR